MNPCPSCGHENQPDAKFCSQCAAPLTARPAVARREERKVVTVLFADLVGFTSRAERMDPEDVRRVLAPYHAHLRAELERFGGTVEKFIGDAVMALFGAPIAHEDDPERAVRAALSIREWVREQNDELQLRIAVTTGEALIDLAARPEAGEGMAAGDVVNTAARLQTAAPVNGILVGETAYRATRHVIDYRPAEPIVAKGKAEPVPVWEAVEARARVGTEAASRRTPLVGRARELAQLVEALARARETRAPQLVTLVGVPGIGKSRLVAELLGHVEADPEFVNWRHGRSLPYGEGLSYWALGEIVKAQAAILETDSAADAERKLAEAVAALVPEEEAERIASSLSPLVGLAELEPGGDRREDRFAAWRRFFEALAATRPLVLVFEDLHWADDDLLDFLDELSDWVENVPLLVLGTARPELLDRRPSWGGGKRNAVSISLPPLDEEDTARLIAAALDRAVLPAETQTLLLARAGGNPLYAEQFAYMVAEGGGSDLPETVQGIVAARLDALPGADKALLQDAAVLGKVFWASALAAIGGAARDELEPRLRALARKEFARREPATTIAGELQYSFAHLIVRDVAYGQIPRPARAEKHRLAAAWIESLAPDRSEDRAEMLAHHYLSALELSGAAGIDASALTQPAAHALQEAGDRALALGAYPNAISYYDSALELGGLDDWDTAVATVNRTDARFQLGGQADEEELARVVELFLAAGEPERAAEAEIFAAASAWYDGRRSDADRWAASAVDHVADAPASPVKARVLAEQARLLMLGGEPAPAIRLATKALELSEQLQLDRLAAAALVTRGTARGHEGDDGGNEDLDRALALAHRAGALEVLLRAHNNRAELHLGAARLADTEAEYAEMRRLNLEFGRRRGMAWLEGNESALRYELGQWERALELVANVLDDIQTGSGGYQEPVVLIVRAGVRFARGDAAGALADSERAAARAREQADLQAVGPPLALHAHLLAEEGRTAEAQALVDELLSVWGSGEVPYYSWLVDLPWACVLTGRSERLAELLPATPLRIGWRDPAAAIAGGAFGEAAESYAAIGAAPREALARLWEAERLVDLGRRAEAAEHLTRALGFYRSVGATRYVRRAETLLPASA